VELSSAGEADATREAEMMAAFELARPRIMGALLDAVSSAIRDLPYVQLPTLPRMADFALWVTAAETGLRWPRGTFLAAYQGNRASANDLALESSPVARPLLDILDEHGEWSGTASELLQAIESKVTEQVKRQQSWPKNARSLSGHIKRLSSNLRAAGWATEFVRQSNRRLWTIQRVTQPEASLGLPASLRPVESGRGEEPSPVQNDAESYQWDGGDAHDADDAIFGTSGSDQTVFDDNGDEIPF